MATMRHIGGPVVPKNPRCTPYSEHLKLATLLLDKKSGCTLWYTGREVAPNHGVTWVVGGKRPTLNLKDGDVTEDVVNLVARWIGQGPMGEVAFGSWTEDGVVYIDSVELCATEAYATMIGQERGEIAIYNLLTGETKALWDKWGAPAE